MPISYKYEENIVFLYLAFYYKNRIVMKFKKAAEIMKNGFKVRRESWEQDKYIQIDKEMSGFLKTIDGDNNNDFFIKMPTAHFKNNKLLSLLKMADVLENDWVLYEDVI